MKKILYITLLFILILPAIQPLFNKGFYNVHDNTQVERVIVMGKALRNGQFPVRIVSGLGYGYGYTIFNFYGPLPYYIGGFLYSIGLPALLATKTMIGLGFILLGLTIYFFLRTVFGEYAAITSSIVAVYMPYHAVQIYVRGSVGELWLGAFIPLVIFGIYEIIINKKYKKGILIGAIGLSGTILSHTLLGYVTIILLAVLWFCYIFFAFIKNNHLKASLNILYMILSGVGASAFFWLPAMLEKGYTNVSGQLGATTKFSDHYVCITQFFNSSWGFGGSIPGCIDGMSFALGKVNILLILVGLFVFILTSKSSKHKFIGGVASLLVFGSVFFASKTSNIAWLMLPGFEYIQYPWRFLTFILIGVALFTVLLIGSIKINFLRNIFSTLVIVLILVSSVKYFRPQFINNMSSVDYESLNNLSFKASKISDEYLPKEVLIPKNQDEIKTNLFESSEYFESKIVEFTETYKKIEFLAKKPQEIIFNIAHFPGWRYWVNGKEQYPQLDYGRPVLYIPKDFSTVQIRFTNTPYRKLGNAISLLSMLILVYIYGKKTIS